MVFLTSKIQIFCTRILRRAQHRFHGMDGTDTLQAVVSGREVYKRGFVNRLKTIDFPWSTTSQVLLLARSAFIWCHASLASVTEPSSSIVVMSPGSLSRITAFSTRRMILPLRVFGSILTKLTSLTTAIGPSSRRTVSSNSFFSSTEG